MPGTLRVRSYRQRKAGARGRYSHRDLYGGPTTRPANSAQPAGIAECIFLPGRCRVLCVSGIAQKGTTAMTDQLAAGYEGTEPFPDVGDPPRTVAGAVRVAVTLAIVIVPFAGLGVAVWLAWGHGLSLADVLLAVAFYLVTGLGVTIGFHRLLTHRSFTAAPALRVVLAIAGSMSFEGEVIGWVAIHRRHHAFSDRPGDPHSPYRYGTSLPGQLRGLAHAHVGWLLRDDPTPAARYAPDMVADPAMRAVSAAFPALCAVSLGLPFGAGLGDRRLARRTDRPAVGRTGPRHPAAARHLERQLAVPRDRRPPLHYPPLRPRHQLVAPRAALPRRKLAQHAPFRSSLCQAWRRSPAGRYLRRCHSHLRAPRLGDRRALACSRPPGLPPPRSGPGPGGTGTPGQ